METNGDEPALHPETALALFRVGQECLMNVAKHSGAAYCNVSLSFMRDRVTLEIEDHGKGFELGELREKPGLGIESMRERLRSTGGTLRIESSPHRGTKVHAETPIVQAPHAELNHFSGQSPTAHVA